jgi:transposase
MLNDEFAFRKGYEYGTAVMDASTRQALEIVEGKNEDAVMKSSTLK